MKNLDYENKKAREIAWYEQNSDKNQSVLGRILHHPVFWTQERNLFNYIFPKQQMAEVVRRHLKEKQVDKLLIAPCGTGMDFDYLSNLAFQVYGIDLSATAVEKCSPKMNVKTGDILDSGYPDETFDLIASPLFFHHLLKFGFDAFLKEFLRILKKGGRLVIQEPSLLYPLNLITRPIKIISQNAFNEVEDEDPFYPGLMLTSLKRVGFTNLEIHAATFSHCTFYVPLANLVNKLTKPLLHVSPFNYFGWFVNYWAEKK
jgi:SAM-dependent methyltransferase